MKRVLYIFSFLTVLSLAFTSCEKDITTEDNSKITYYVTFELEGESLMSIPVGQGYVEPGFAAMEGTADVTSDVEIVGAVDKDNLGLYTIQYVAKNADGFLSSISRTVIVYDPNAPETDISGSYVTSIVRTESDGSNPRNYSGDIEITQIAKGIFYVDCLLGATYSVYYGYGANYAMTGYISLNADNSISLLSSYVKGWGDGLEGFQNGVYNAETGLPYWESVYAGGDIYAVTTTK